MSVGSAWNGRKKGSRLEYIPSDKPRQNAYIWEYNRIIRPFHRYCVSTAGHRRCDIRNVAENRRAGERWRGPLPHDSKGESEKTRDADEILRCGCSVIVLADQDFLVVGPRSAGLRPGGGLCYCSGGCRKSRKDQETSSQLRDINQQKVGYNILICI